MRCMILSYTNSEIIITTIGVLVVIVGVGAPSIFSQVSRFIIPLRNILGRNISSSFAKAESALYRSLTNAWLHANDKVIRKKHIL